MDASDQEKIAPLYQYTIQVAAYLEILVASGYSGADAINVVFDRQVVFGVWRDQLGLYDVLILKGADIVERAYETGNRDFSCTYYNPGSRERALIIKRHFWEDPNARWYDDEPGSGFLVIR